MKTTLEIHYLKCGGCENTIKKRLGNLQFVKNLEINVDDSTVNFDVLPAEDFALVWQKLSEMGYPVIDDSNNFGKKAKSYVSCALGRIQG